MDSHHNLTESNLALLELFDASSNSHEDPKMAFVLNYIKEQTKRLDGEMGDPADSEPLNPYDDGRNDKEGSSISRMIPLQQSILSRIQAASSHAMDTVMEKRSGDKLRKKDRISAMLKKYDKPQDRKKSANDVVKRESMDVFTSDYSLEVDAAGESSDVQVKLLKRKGRERDVDIEEPLRRQRLVKLQEDIKVKPAQIKSKRRPRASPPKPVDESSNHDTKDTEKENDNNIMEEIKQGRNKKDAGTSMMKLESNESVDGVTQACDNPKVLRKGNDNIGVKDKTVPAKPLFILQKPRRMRSHVSVDKILEEIDHCTHDER
ncbi:hypothetical protein HDU67_009593 [Dinochytrium kinnereticum]|nr:hypothetical protein HDU67_009593 [Dinochytrium kinnereticum]